MKGEEKTIYRYIYDRKLGDKEGRTYAVVGIKLEVDEIKVIEKDKTYSVVDDNKQRHWYLPGVIHKSDIGKVDLTSYSTKKVYMEKRDDQYVINLLKESKVINKDRIKIQLEDAEAEVEGLENCTEAILIKE